MKYLIIIAFIFYSATSNAQWSVTNDQLQWQKIFDHKITLDQLAKVLRHNGLQITENSGAIEFSLPYTTNTLKKYGYKRSNYPVYLNSGTLYGYAEVKEGRYRITINSIMMVDSFDDSEISLSFYTVKNNEIRSGKMHQKSLILLNKFFSNLFKFNNIEDGW